MNEHSKSIWKAWLDEKEVQYYAQFGENSPTYAWINADPSDPDLFTPQECPHRWRIKPETEHHGFRVYWDKEEDEPRCYQYFYMQDEFEKTPCFGSWLTDWITYDSEVEQ